MALLDTLDAAAVALAIALIGAGLPPGWAGQVEAYGALGAAVLVRRWWVGRHLPAGVQSAKPAGCDGEE